MVRVRWLDGTLTSELLGLADADADAHWIGIRRHQALLAVAGIGVMAQWLLRARGSLFELLVGALLVLAAAPSGDGRSVGEHAAALARFGARSRWSRISLVEGGHGFLVDARGRGGFCAYRLEHRGRLDLSGRDVAVASGLAALVDAIGVGGPSRHVAVHVQSPSAGGATMLSIPPEAAVPEGWSTTANLAYEVAGVVPTGPTMVLERWRYVRTPDALAATLRIRDFSASPKGRALLERLQVTPYHLTLAVHVDVVAGTRAKRVVERAVHRSKSDGAASLAAGFRRTQRVEGRFERVAQRETLVASGRALVRIAVYVTVRGETVDDLVASVRSVSLAARASGLRCDRGGGRQIEWHCFQLPGGPGW